jgi:O-antigen/teichoic acid export membrane protein
MNSHTGAPAAAPVNEVAGNRLRRDRLMTTGSGLAVFGLAFLTGPILARSLGVSGRGVVAAVLIPTQVLGWMLMFGIPQATAYYARQRDARQLTMSSWVFATVVGVPVVAIIWPFVPSLLSRYPPIAVDYFRAFLVASLLVLPFTNTVDLLRGLGQITAFNIYRLLQYVVNAVLLLLLFLTDHLDVRLALLVALVANVGTWVLTIGVNGAWPGRGFRRSVFREQLHYGSRASIGTMSAMVIARFDQVLMVGIVAPAQLGLYVVAASVAQITGPIGQGVALSLFPHLRVEADDPEQQHQMTKSALRWTLLASSGVVALVALAAPFALPWVYGQAFAPAVIPLLILLPGQVCLDMANVLTAKLGADNRPGRASMGSALGAVTTIVFVIPAVALFGINGAAFVTSTSQALFLAFVWFSDRQGGRR